ncbi:MAG: hypothetical protein HWQ43_29290 [Nostoc sp. JL31]|uniref:hypothetical protein n=1 Tax=Nostoc sp. JL31 TaxID=2815395 RepID=UPI0025ECAF9C|nr:hypothetical protein [Nostoc sp. JL31]MBN3893045.1 hypothetical protein [Nostoc sp. JL31]
MFFTVDLLPPLYVKGSLSSHIALELAIAKMTEIAPVRIAIIFERSMSISYNASRITVLSHQ